MVQDLRLGLKLLWKEKAFTATALLTLALCIGANTAIFSLLKSIVLDPLPFPEADRLVTMYNVYPGVGVEQGSNGVPDYLDRRQMTDVFESVALIGDSGYDAGAAGLPEHIEGQYVTPDFFQVLRVPPAFGRIFTAAEAVQGNDKYAVLSYGLWKDMFGRDRGAIGKDIRLSGVPYRIIGVMPAGFGMPGGEVKVWVPFAFSAKQTSDDARHSNSWGMAARLKPGVSVAYAQQRIDILNRRNLDRFPKYRKLLVEARFGTKVVGLKDELVRDVRPALYLLQAAVALVLLIGCVNVASLMLVRSNIRMKEMAVRFSLGASRGRLGRQLLTEGVLLAVLGGLLGCAVAWVAVPLLGKLGAAEMPRGSDLHIDRVVLAFSGAISILTGLLFASVPVLHLFRRDLNQIFRQTERTGTAERRAIWTRSALVVSQVALAFVLLIGSALLALSFQRLLAVDPGFRPQNVLTAQFSLPKVRYQDDAGVRNFIQDLLQRVRSLPGVTATGVTGYLPFSGGNNSSVIRILDNPLDPGDHPPVPAWSEIDSGYFRALGIPLLQGRSFAESDTHDAQQVVIIDQFLARKYWPKGDALGGRIRRGLEKTDAICTVIGVVGSVKGGDLAEQNPVGLLYFHYKQRTDRSMHLVVRTDRDDPQLTGAIRAQLRSADTELSLFDVKTMPQRLSTSMRNRRAAMVLCLIFGGLALLLSAIGLYGVLAYAVAQRTREFGIRVALGAGAGDVVRMVVSHGLKLAIAGLALGAVAAIAVTRLMTTLLFNVRPGDPGVFAAVAAILLLVAAIASLLPTVRALRIRPASALRYE